MSIKHRFDFSSVLAKSSTWLATISASCTGALAAYALVPDSIQSLVSVGVMKAVAMGAIVSAAAIPIATSFKQRNLGRATQVVITKETKVEGDVTPEAATEIAAAVTEPGKGEA
jgi:hypothetical protein